MEMAVNDNQRKLGFIIFLCFISVVFGATDPNDLKILFEFRDGLDNPELLNWPSTGDNPCGPPKWDHVFCNGDRVSQIQVQNMGLKGPLPQSFNELTQLENLGLQRNNFNGKLPTFSGLSELKYAYLGNNQFDTIPSDFFNGLNNLLVVSLENNPLNATSGWSIPTELQNSPQLTNLTLSGCNLVGPLPDFLGHMSSLTALKLSYNRLSGEIPATFNESQLQILWLNNQDGSQMSGSIDVIASMVSLRQVWLHGNHFTGTIPANIGDLASLRDLNLNQNDLVGLIPESLATLELENLNLNNNKLMGPIPKFKSGNITYSGNSFCQSVPGISCSSEVMALLDFLGNLRYPSNLASSWSGNSPCEGPWAGLNCNPTQKVSVINLPRFKLTGTLSPSIGKLNSLIEIRLGGNHLTGSIPSNFTELQSLRLLDLSGNNLDPPLPKFRATVQLITDGNPKLSKNQTVVPPPPPLPPPPPPPKDNSTRETPPPPLKTPSPPSESKPSPPPSESKHSPPDTSGEEQFHSKGSKNFKIVTIVAPLVGFMVFVLLVVPLSICYCKKRKRNPQSQTSFVVHPRGAADPENMVKIAVSNNNNSTLSTLTGCSSESRNSSGMGESHVIESGNLIISVQVLRNVTKNFAPENQLGRGGFGTVYKGELDDGTKIAVKRMEAGVITNTALHEFQAEITVLSKVRHRHLVSLLGYSIEGGEKLLVYEYMPQGALSRHLFHRESLKIEPLSWKRRLNIALDVARGLEYLHNLAHQSFIHRDLKSANILLGDDYRAKISDFGLVKLAPDGQNSVVTRLAGTFGYLAPEYAVTGKITTKADVFSFGVVLMELLTGLMALDESRPEESRYLAAWFWRIKSSEEKLKAAIDPVLDLNEETFESISIIAELAGHCTAREPNQRPDMGHVVNVLSPLVEKWKPFDDEAEEYSGIDYNLPLTQMVKVWQEGEGKDESYSGLEDSKGSIPARPTGFAESFTSADGR